MTNRALKIFVAESNPGEVKLIELGLKETGIPCHVTVALNGEMALDGLIRSVQTYVPDLILLALRLPKFHGGEVYAAIKREERVRKVPIALLGEPYDWKQIGVTEADYWLGYANDICEF